MQGKVNRQLLCRQNHKRNQGTGEKGYFERNRNYEKVATQTVDTALRRLSE
jgi:hypothetical protein